MRPIDTAAPAVKPEPLAPAPEPLLRDATGRADIPAIANAVTQRAATDPVGARAQFDAVQSALNPVEQGELARAMPLDAWGAFDFPIPLPPIPIPGLPGLPGLPGGPDLPDLPNPIDILKEGIEKIGDGVEALQHAAQAVKEKLEQLPHAIADKIADAMRGDKSRPLTADETAAVQAAFGNRVDLSKVRFVDGPGNSPIARAAFAKGNPAITIGNTVYFKPGHYSADFAATPEGRNTLVHELTHVVQYKEMGYAAFGAKYAADLKRVGGDPDKLYDYQSRDTTYATETLEGQAQMVGDYAQIRGSTDPALQSRIADLERRLAGTGIYGL